MSLQGISPTAGVVTAAALVRFLPSVGVGMGLQMSRLGARVMTDVTLVRLFFVGFLSSVGVGMSIQITSMSA